MADFENMVNSLPIAYRKDPWVLALLNTIEILDKRVRANAEVMAAQMFLDSMSWQLATEEQEAGLTPEAGNDRKAALSAKWRSSAGKCNIELIRKVCEAWDGTKAEVKYDGHKLLAVFINCEEQDGAGAMMKILRTAIPAHLLFWFTVKRPEVSTGMFVGCALSASSRRTLPEPVRKFAASVYAAAGYGSVSRTKIKEERNI